MLILINSKYIIWLDDLPCSQQIVYIKKMTAINGVSVDFLSFNYSDVEGDNNMNVNINR